MNEKKMNIEKLKELLEEATYDTNGDRLAMLTGMICECGYDVFYLETLRCHKCGESIKEKK